MSKICEICRAIYVPKKHSHNQKYCCRSCNKKAYYRSPKGQLQAKGALKRTMLRYHSDPEFRKTWIKRGKEYKNTEKGRLTKTKFQKNYRKSQIGIDSDRKYRQSPKRKVASKRYTISFKGKMNSFRASMKRRAAFHSIIHEFDDKQWENVLYGTKGICKSCNTYVGIRKMTLDHIYPVSKALKDFEKRNIKRIYTNKDVQALCLHCHISKNDQILEQIAV